jgi:hypothetical protein
MSDKIIIKVEASTQSPHVGSDNAHEGSDNESENSEMNEEELMELESYGVSSNIKHNPIFGANAKVWKFFHVLTKPIPTKKKSRTGKLAKTLTHLCLLCLKKIEAMEKRTNATWKNALCRPTNSTHAIDRIKKLHRDNSETQQIIQHQNDLFDSKYSQRSTVSTTSTVAFGFKKASKDASRLVIFIWLVCENKQFNTIQSPYFKSMFTGISPYFTVMCRDTFISILVREFGHIVTTVKEMIMTEKKYMHLFFVFIYHA